MTRMAYAASRCDGVCRRRQLAMAVMLLCGLTCGHASAQSLERIFSKANEAYFQGDFSAAAEHYEKLIQAGVDDGDVYYNLATAYARAGQLGRAILFFERSARANPNDEAAEAGLAACRAALGKRRAERKGEATVQTRPPLSEALLRPLSENLLAWLLAVFVLGFFAVLIAMRLPQREPVRVGMAVTASLLLILLLSTGGALLVKSQALKEGRAAVVLREEAALHEGPDPRAQVRGVALEGQRARILGREGRFVRVRLAGGSEGWMKQQDVGQI